MGYEGHVSINSFDRSLGLFPERKLGENDPWDSGEVILLTVEQHERIEAAHGFVMAFFKKFSIRDGDYMPHAYMMKNNLHRWAAGYLLQVENSGVEENMEKQCVPLYEKYPQFGLGDISFAARYYDFVYSSTSAPVGSEEYKASQALAYAWKQVEKISYIATDIESSEIDV